MEPTSAPSGHAVTFVGNATVLLRLGPFTLLTDPNFLRSGQRAYLGYGLWSKRLKDPAMSVGDLPPLDAVVLSHLHGDHWDRVAEAGLDRSVPVLTTEQAASTLARRGFSTEAMHVWDSVDFTKGEHRLTISSMPGEHARGLLRHALPDVMGSLIDLYADDRRLLRVYVTGDTLCVPQLQEIAERYPDIDVALVHLGGTKLLGVFLVTMDGRQGAELVDMLQPGLALPIHHDDYTVFTSPASDFLAETARRNTRTAVQPLARGETLPLDATAHPDQGTDRKDGT